MVCGGVRIDVMCGDWDGKIGQMGRRKSYGDSGGLEYQWDGKERDGLNVTVQLEEVEVHEFKPKVYPIG